MNKQYRLAGYNFVVAAPLAELLILRICLEPFRHLLVAHLLHSGKSWEKEQQAADILFCLGKAGTEPRQYRACIAAKGCLDAEFMGMVFLDIFSMGGIGSTCPPTSALSIWILSLLQDPVSNGLRSARTLVFAPRAISNEIVFASRGHRPWRGVREDLGSE